MALATDYQQTVSSTSIRLSRAEFEVSKANLIQLDDELRRLLNPPLAYATVFTTRIRNDRMHRMNEHEKHMRRAIELAANVPNFPFGALIVKRESDEIIAEGWNKSSLNPTWHGEIDAINRLAELRPKFDGSRLSLYTTAEPCPMCQSAILWSGIETVVYGTSIRSLQRLGWRQIDILAEEVIRRSPEWRCTLIGGVLEQECDSLFERASSRKDAG